MQALAQGYLLGKIVKRIGEVRCSHHRHHLVRDRPRTDGESADALDTAARARTALLGYGFASPSIASLISKRTERALEGEALGINQSASSMARILGPIAGGLAYGVLGTSAPYVGGAIVAFMAFILARGIGKSDRLSRGGEQFGQHCRLAASLSSVRGDFLGRKPASDHQPARDGSRRSGPAQGTLHHDRKPALLWRMQHRRRGRRCCSESR